MQPIGILGGTFDPVHIGHLRMALELRTTLDLAAVRFIPLADHPFGKQPVATPQQRLQMLQLALHDLPGCELDPRELERGGLSYTVSTLESLRAEVDTTPLCLFLGFDAFQQMDRWHRWDELLLLAHLVVVDRPGMSLQNSHLSTAISELIQQRRCQNPTDLHNADSGLILFQSIPYLEISSTRIRAEIAAGHCLRHLLPDTVIDFIQQHQLYKVQA